MKIICSFFSIQLLLLLLLIPSIHAQSPQDNDSKEWLDEMIRKVIYDARRSLLLITTKSIVDGPLKDQMESELIVELAYLNRMRKIPELRPETLTALNNTAHDIAIFASMDVMPELRNVEKVTTALFVPGESEPYSCSINDLIRDEMAMIPKEELEKRKIAIEQRLNNAQKKQ